ncbi:lysosomal-trafficking regulator-like isoform X2 [Octopus vulgaris]|uniref:Lysosomal-trafficking regulator-like isoform X2 n=1 Tax=Octopus vulgaris TaxID=6645 RepID=A0AA36AFN8_OCTVU|nr:lysosomal-trafficking regulator-like isoform X2 [Octopus vulgaris]
MSVKVTSHNVWDLYLRTPEAQKKSRILDVFLWLVLKEARGKEDYSEPGDMTVTCNQLVQEFMSGILRITNDANEDDVEELQNYLLKGQGVYLLKVIHKIGVKDLSNGRNFTNLLLSLVSWCLKFNSSSESLLTETGIENLSSTLKKSLQNFVPTNNKKRQQVFPSCRKEHLLAISRKQLLNEYMSLESSRELHKAMKPAPVMDRSTSDSEVQELSESNQPPTKWKLDKKRKYKFGESQFLSWQNRYQTLSEENLKGIQRSKIQEVFHPAETCLLMIDIIQNVCLLDLNQTVPSKLVSVSLLPELLDALFRFHDMFQNPNPQVWTKDILAYILKHLLQLVFMLSNITATQQNGSSILIRNRIFPSLLYLAHDLLEDITYPENIVWSEVSDQCHVKMVLVSDIISGLLLCATEVFHNIPLNPVFINSALKVMWIFREERGFSMLELILSWLDSECFPHKVCKKFSPKDNLLKSVSSLVIAMKKAKVGYIHSSTCMKKKHRKCIYTHCFDHHHNILGFAFTKNVSRQKLDVSSDICVVGYWSQFLLDVLPFLKSKQQQLQVFTLFVTAGICCCIGIEVMLSSFHSSFYNLSPAVKNYALDIMNNMLLEQLSGARHIAQKPSKIEICKVCEDDSFDTFSGKLKRGMDPDCKVNPEAHDSGVSSSEISSEDFKSSMKKDLLKRWGSLAKMCDILYSGDTVSASLLSKHLLILAVHGRTEVKQELFHSIYLPILTDYCKWKSTTQHIIPSPLSKSVIMNCLSAFPYLLQAESVMPTFLARHGIEKLWTILEDPSLQELVLHVFEALIIADEYVSLENILKENKVSERLMDENSPVSDFSSDDDLTYCSNMVIRSFLKILSENIKLHGVSINILPKNFLKDSEMNDGEEVNQLSDSSMHLKWFLLLRNLWRTCQVLLLNSPSFLLQFKTSECFMLAKQILFHIIPQLGTYASPTHQFMEPGVYNSNIGDQPLQSVPIFQQALSLLESVLMACIICYMPAFAAKSDTKDFQALLSEVKDGLMKYKTLQVNQLQMIFDTLLRCAKPDRSTILELSSLHTLMMYSKDDDLVDEEEVRQLLQQGTDTEMECLLIECGYDADSEFSLSDDLKGKPSRSKESDLYLTQIHFASVYRLIIELMIHMNREGYGQGIFHRILYQLVQTCREDQGAMQAMSSEGIAGLILNGMKEDLLGKTSINKETQILLFTYIQQLAQNQITAAELKLLLRLFMEDGSPYDLLLSTLTGIVENYRVSPTHYVQFPVTRQDSSNSNYNGSSSINSSSKHKMESGCDNDVHPGSSPKVISLAPVTMQVSNLLPWPPYQNGFSVSLWLQLGDEVLPDQWIPGTRSKEKMMQDSTDMFDNGDHHKTWLRSNLSHQTPDAASYISNECLHIFSVGTEEKMFEIWADPCIGTLVVRLTSLVSGSTVILKECSAPSLLNTNRWHHLILQYREVLDENILSGKVSIVLDGWWSQEMVLDHSRDIRMTQLEPTVYLGHTRNYRNHLLNRKKSWYLGPLMLFKGANLSQEICFHLHALGPNCSSISKCDCSEQAASYIPQLFKNVVCFSGVSTDTLVGINQVNLDTARNNLILIYNPQHPKLFSLYCAGGSSQLPNSLGLTLGILPPSMIQSRDLLEQHPLVVPVKVAPSLEILACFKNCLEQSAEEMGGINVFMFLVAKVFEKCRLPSDDSDQGLNLLQMRQDMEKLQASALNLLFQMIKQVPSMCLQYMESQGDRMISRVLETSRSLISFRILKVLLDAATTESVMRFDSQLNTYIIKEQTLAIVQNMSVIENLLLRWRIWTRGPSSVMELLFKALECLVRDDHPHQMFNIKQYQAGNFVQRVFLMYQELVREHEPVPSATISSSIVAIIQKMVGSPPDSHLIVAVCDFLLLMHPAADTYINYARSGFYFSCWWGVPGTPIARRISRKNRTIDQVRLASLGDYDNEPEGTRKGLFRTVSFVSSNKPVYDRQIGMNRPRSASYPSNNELRGWKTQKDKQNYAEQFQDGKKLSSKIHSQSEKTPDSCGTENSFNEADSNDINDNSACSSGKSAASAVDGNLSQKLSSIDQDNSSSLCRRPLYSLSESMSPTSCDIGSSLDSDDDDDDDDVYESEDHETTEKGLVVLCAGLLELMCSTLIVFDETQLDKLLFNVINARVLIVLAHNSSAEIRALVIRLLDIYLQRCRNNHVEVFLKLNGFHLLATQLYHYQSEKSLVEMAFSIMLAKQFTMDEGFDFSQLHHVNQVQLSSAPLLLSLLEKSSEDFALASSFLIILHQMFECNSVICAALMDSGLTETLCNFLAKMNQFYNRPMDERQTVFDRLKKLFTAVALREFSLSGNSHYQNFEEILSLLKALEEREKIVYGPSSFEVKNIKQLEYHIFYQSLQFVEVPHENNSSSAQRGRSKTNNEQQQSLKNKELKNSQWSLLPLSDPTDKFLSNISQWSTLWGQKKKKETNKVAGSELSDRLRKLIVMAVDLVVFGDNDSSSIATGLKLTFVFNGPSDAFTSDSQFRTHLLDFLVKSLASIQEKGILQSRKPKASVFHSAKDTLLKQTARLIVSMLSPGVEFYERIFVVFYMVKEIKHREIFKSMFASSPWVNSLLPFLHELLSSYKDQMSNSQQDNINCLFGLLKKSGSRLLFSPEIHNNTPDKGKLEQEIKTVSEQLEEEKQEWLKRRHQHLSRILYIKNESLIKNLADSAMEVTQQVFRMQNKERKELVTHLKQSMTDRIQIKKSWQDLVQQLTHEKAIWFCPQSYPRSWQLDPTEGPCRIRKRMQRCHLGISERYISPKFWDKLTAEKVDPPLLFLFEDDHQTSDSAALMYRLYTSEKIQFTCGCTTVSPSSESKGELLIGERNVYFVADVAVSDMNYTQVLLGNKDQLSMTWPQMDIKEFLPRWYQLKDVGLEIFLTNGKTCLLAFNSTEERNQTMKQLENVELPNLVKGENMSSIQQLWGSGRMTNFEYLTLLNKIAGRSFNDLMQYPIFPFIIRNYENEELDLSNQSLYRDLSKPIAVQDKSREKKYIENYQYLKQEYEKFLSKNDETFYRVAPYHYGSHYSNSGTVLHFLVRLPPFTKMFLNFQDNHFDLPDRTFHNMAVTWKLSSYQSISDVKELIPEFFFQPEMFLNSEGFDFGTKQTGDLVWDVQLPSWCQGNARLFVLIHRQALESPYVSENIHRWINLVYGYKQQGDSAVQAINVFHPATYFGVDVDSEKDPVHRQALITMIKTYGQTPKQLLRTPHPQLPPYLLTQIFPSLANIGKPTTTISSLSCVKGLNWGDYVGSPDCPPPAVIHRKETRSVAAVKLIALQTGEVFGIRNESCLLTMCSKDRGVIGINTTDVIWAAILSWKHPDGILRITNNPDRSPVNFLQVSPYDQTTCIASVPDCRLLFIGGRAGVITVYTTLHNTAKKSHLQVLGHKKQLYGHTCPITTITVCKSYSIFVSASEDGLCIIWDLNRLSYVRSIEGHTCSVNTIAISETLGDIVTISSAGVGSIMMLHTVNAQLVAVHNCEDRILCAAYSSAAEGRSVNVIAGGLSAGIVRLWNSWTLEPVRDLVDEALKGKQILSLTFTHDSQHLMAPAIM